MTKNKNDNNGNDILEIVTFIKDNAVNKADFARLEGKVEKIESTVEKLDARLTRVEALMVTKDYLDDKLADLRGDLVVLTRKEDTKVKCLVEILQKKKLLTTHEAKQIFTMEPFAQIA